MTLPEQLKILVVEDEPTDVMLLRRRLQQQTETHVDIVDVSD